MLDSNTFDIKTVFASKNHKICIYIYIYIYIYILGSDY